MRKSGFKKDLPELPPREYFHVYITNFILLISNHTVFLVQFGINLHSFSFFQNLTQDIHKTNQNIEVHFSFT